jgi:hypothetical protein
MVKHPARSRRKHRPKAPSSQDIGALIAAAFGNAVTVQCVKIFLNSVPRFSSVSRHGAASRFADNLGIENNFYPILSRAKVAATRNLF